jgi:cytochrome b
MNTTSASLAEGSISAAAAATAAVPPTVAAAPASGRSAAPSRRMVDAPTRAFHWLLALCFAGAYATSEGEHWRLVHVTLGYTMVGLLGFRTVWGLVGPRPARFGTWWRKLQALPPALRQMRLGVWPATLLQNLTMTLAIVAVILTVALTTASGWIAYEEFTGDWMAELHDLAGNTLLALVVLHIGAVIVLSLLRSRNLVTPMLTGRQAGHGPDLVTRNLGWLAALLLAAVLAFWWLSWRDAPTNTSPAGEATAAVTARGSDDD